MRKATVERPLDAVVLDPELPSAMGRVLNRLFDAAGARQALLSDIYLVLGVGAPKKRRQQLLARFRDFAPHDLAHLVVI